MALMYMWGALFITAILAFNALIACLEWANARQEWNRDSVELRGKARYARLSLLLIPAGPLWPVALPVAAVYGLIVLIKSLNKDSEHNL